MFQVFFSQLQHYCKGLQKNCPFLLRRPYSKPTTFSKALKMLHIIGNSLFLYQDNALAVKLWIPDDDIRLNATITEIGTHSTTA